MNTDCRADVLRKALRASVTLSAVSSLQEDGDVGKRPRNEEERIDEEIVKVKSVKLGNMD